MTSGKHPKKKRTFARVQLATQQNLVKMAKISCLNLNHEKSGILDTFSGPPPNESVVKTPRRWNVNFKGQKQLNRMELAEMSFPRSIKDLSHLPCFLIWDDNRWPLSTAAPEAYLWKTSRQTRQAQRVVAVPSVKGCMLPSFTEVQMLNAHLRIWRSNAS